MQKTLGAVFLLVGALTFSFMIRTASHNASILFVNGTIYTLDPQHPVAGAIAVQGGRVLAVGSGEELRARFTVDTVVDLRGNTVLPGLTDGHAHVLGEGSALHNLDLVGTASADQIVGLVADRVRRSDPGQWIVGRGWDQNDWEVKAFPTKALLDAVAPDNPVVLTRVDGHAYWVNSRALERATISAETPDPYGGKLERDPQGEPTGVLIDHGMDLIARVVPELTDSDVEERLKLAMDACARLGLTEVHDMGVDHQTIAAYERLIDRGECPIRIYAAIDGSGPTWDEATAGPSSYGDRLAIRALKLYMDGALGSRGAALIDGYSDDPTNRGLTRTSEEAMKKLCTEALGRGFQVCTHAIGDRGNKITLDVYEDVLRKAPRPPAEYRWRIEHCQVLAPEDVPRFAALGILPSMQPTHATSDMYWAETRLGPERIKGAYAWRSLLATGAHIIGGSDFPVEGVSPLWGIYAAVTRRDKSGYPQDGWMPEQRMTREEAVRAFTSWAAYGAFEDERKGTLEPGKWADMTVLTKDIFRIPDADILTTEVAMTVVGGKIVYRTHEGNP